MNLIDDLRPELHPIDAEWSAATLQHIFADEVPVAGRRRARRRLMLVGAGAAAMLGCGGVAYATGLIPDAVTRNFAWISSSGVEDVHEVATFSIAGPDGPRAFTIWRGTSTDGLSCTSVLETGATGSPDFSGNCGDYPTDAWFDTRSDGYGGTIDDPPPPLTYFVYGEPADPHVTSVRVVGDGFDDHTTIDPSTGGYAIAIPELHRGVSGPFATVQFLDAAGEVVGQRVLSEK